LINSAAEGWCRIQGRGHRLDRFVALKFLPEVWPKTRSPWSGFGVKRKQRRPESPNICTIYDIGEENGQSFIAMEYLDGQTLST